jgi:hypothetical protein
VRAKLTAKVEAPELASVIPFGIVGWEVRVYRVLSRAGEAWELEVLDRRGRVLRTEAVAETAPRDAAGPRFVGFEWAGTEFLLLDDDGRATYRIELAPVWGFPAA